ncbi:hypothetical protein AWJ20_2239 [Sugiyamaella lignohabitans]|uniref:Uncharacterized protein n=1 Tax=Sugiyamaella lignohabitans TaxID=796027 RepID=A0A167EZ86_9ASCO|nr:uncharacterized protein AWJ20_2239 [Sugiyamaella lignohabitans]ANB14634.1 hypothetical protein AWJ20_2239 [Sugiyamaella lignohabitans]
MAVISKQLITSATAATTVAAAPLSPWGKAVAGALAAMAANALVYPLDIVKTRLQVQTEDDDLETGEKRVK